MRIAAVLLVLAVALDGQSPSLAPAIAIDGDAAIVTILVKPDKVAEFDRVLERLRTVLQNGAPVRGTQAAGWSVFKATDLVQGNVSYIMRIDPAVKDQEYDVARLIGEADPAAAMEVNRSIRDAQVGRSVMVMNRVNVDGLGLAVSAGSNIDGPAAAAAPVLAFQDVDAAVITVLVRPEFAADYESVLARMGRALQASAAPVRRRQAAGWKVFKGTQLLSGNVPYIMILDPVQPRADYDPMRLIQEVFPSELQDIFPRYRAAFAGQAVVGLGRRIEMRR